MLPVPYNEVVKCHDYTNYMKTDYDGWAKLDNYVHNNDNDDDYCTLR